VSTPALTLARADADTVERVVRLLDANDLPSRDVAAEPDRFRLAYVDGDLVGIGGLEAYGTAGLLRSVVVRERYRGEGYGVALCDALESEARRAGVGTLYLLTTTAAAFFRARGYEPVDRSTVPDSIAGTTEFETLCPASATALRKPLD